MASKEQLIKVAQHCDKYHKVRGESAGYTNNSNQGIDNCTRCSHFTKDGLCELDLVDKVLSSLSMELDFKS